MLDARAQYRHTERVSGGGLSQRTGVEGKERW